MVTEMIFSDNFWHSDTHHTKNRITMVKTVSIRVQNMRPKVILVICKNKNLLPEICSYDNIKTAKGKDFGNITGKQAGMF